VSIFIPNLPKFFSVLVIESNVFTCILRMDLGSPSKFISVTFKIEERPISFSTLIVFSDSSFAAPHL